MKLRTLALAQADVASAVAYYNVKEPGLSGRFVAAFNKTIDRLLDHPEACVAISDNLRRCQISKFPYSLFYSLSSNTITIIAVLHNRREALEWQKRIGSSIISLN